MRCVLCCAARGLAEEFGVCSTLAALQGGVLAFGPPELGADLVRPLAYKLWVEGYYSVFTWLAYYRTARTDWTGIENKAFCKTDVPDRFYNERVTR